MVRSENISDSSYEHLNPDDATNIKNNDGPSLEPSGKIDEDKNTKTKHKDKNMDENINSSRQSHLDTDLGRIHITEEETVIEDIDYVTQIENEDLKEVKTVITEERKLLSDGEECITYVVTTYIVHEPESFKDLLSDDDEDTFYTIPNDDTDIDLSLDDDDDETTTQDENVVPEIVDDVFFIPKGVKAQNNIADDNIKEGNNTKISSDEVKPRKIPKLSADMNIRIPKETASFLREKEFYNLTPITPVEVIDFPFGEDDKEKEIEAPINKKSKTDIEIIEISSDEEDSTELKVSKNSDFEDVSEESNPMQENTTGPKIVEIKHTKDEKEESKENISQHIKIIVISSGDEDSLETEFSKIRDANSLVDNSDTNSIVEEKTETIIISSDEEKEDRMEMRYEEESKQPNPIYIIENDIIIVDISDEEDSLEENNRVNLKTELEQADMYQKENNKPEFEEEGEENRVDKNETPFDVIKNIDNKETTAENEVYSEDSLEGETDKNNANNNNNNNNDNNVITPGDENTSKNKSLNKNEVKKEADEEESDFSKAIDNTITPFENIKVEIKLENPIQDPITPIEVVIHVPDDNETSENMNNDAQNLESKERQSGKKSPFTIIYVPDEDTSSNDTNKVKEESNSSSMNRNTGSVKDIAKNQSSNETDFEEIDVENYLEKNVKDTNAIEKNMNAEKNLNDRNKENVHSSFCDVDVVGNNKEVARENKEGGRIDFVKSNQEKLITLIGKEILFDMGNIKQDVLRNEIQIENQEENNETQEIEKEDNMMNVKEDDERIKEDDQNLLESSEDEDTLDNIPEIEIDCSESNEQSAHLDIIACNDPEVVLMVDDDAMDNNADTAIIGDQENMEDNKDTKTNLVEMSFVDEVVMKGEYIKEDDKEEEAAMEIDMDENVNTKDALKTKNYPNNNQNLYDKENFPPIQCLENQTKKDKPSQTNIGNKDVEFVVEKCMIDLIDLITTLGMKTKENDSFYENDPIVACVQNKIDEIQSHPDKNMKKDPVKLSKYQQFENTPFLAIGRNIVTRKPNTKRVRKGKKKTKETKKENETLDDQVSKDVPIITQNNQTLVKPIEEESKEEFTLYYPLSNESDVSIYPIILDFEQNEIEVADTVPLMNESDNYNESGAVEGHFERKKSESSEKENEKYEENKTESFCLDIAINEKEKTEGEFESANTTQTDDSSDLIPEKTRKQHEEMKTEFSSDDPLIEENSNTFSLMTIIDSIKTDTQSISREPLIVEDENSLDQISENEASRHNETEYRTEDEFSSDSIPEDSEENKTESFAEETLIHEEDYSEDPSKDVSEEKEVITNSSDAGALIDDNESSDNPGKEKNENNETEPLINREKEDLNPMPKECEESIGDISISEPLVDKDDSSEDPISEMDNLISNNSEDSIEDITNEEPLIEEEDTSTNTMKSEVDIIETTIKDKILQDLITENPDESTNDSPIAGLLLSEEDSTSMEIITEDISVEPLVHEVETITNICDEKLANPASSVQLVKEYDNALDQILSTNDSPIAGLLLSEEDSTSIEIITEDTSVEPLVHEVETITNSCDEELEKTASSIQLVKEYDNALDQTSESFEEVKTETTSLEIFHEDKSFNETTDYFEENKLGLLLDDNGVSANTVTKNKEENGKEGSSSKSKNEEDNSDTTNNHVDESSNENNLDDSEPLDNNDGDDDDQDESHADSIPEDSKNGETDSIKTELLLVVSNESLTDEMIFSCDLSADDEDPGLQKGDDELFDDSDIAIVNDVLEKMIDEIAEDETLREGDMEADRELCFSPCLIDPESILEENTDSQSSPEHPPQVHVKLNVKIREELRNGKEDIAMVYAIEERTTGKKINNEQRVYIDVQEANGETATHSIDIKQADVYLAPFIGPHAEDDIPCEENIGDKKADECCERIVDDKSNVDTSFEEILNTEDVDGNTEENKEEINGTKRPEEDVSDEDDSDPLAEEENNTNDAKHNKEDLAIASEEERAASVTDENETKTVSNTDEDDTKTVSTTDEEKLVLRDISHNEEDLIIASSLPEELELVSVINSILESIEENQKLDDTSKENEKPKSKIESDESLSKSDEGTTATSALTLTSTTTNIPPQGDNLYDLVDEEESILIPLTEVQVTLAYNDIVRLDADKTTNNLESTENSTDLPNQNPQTSVPSQPRRKVYYPEKYPDYNPTPPPSPVYQPNQIKRSKKLFPPIPKPVSYHAEYINTNKNPRVLRRGPNQSKSADITTYTYKGSISSVGEYGKTQVKKANIEDQHNVELEDQKNTDVQNDISLIDEILGNRDSIKIDDNENEDGKNKSTSDAKDQDPGIDDKSLSVVDNKKPDNENSQKRLEENEETVNEGERVITHEERVKRRKYLEEQKQDEEAPFTGEKVISAEDRRLRRLQLIKVE